MTVALVPDEIAGPLRQRRVEVTVGALAVVEVGPADAPAAVVAHGAGSSACFVVAAFTAPAAAAGLRLVTYDLRGHGASSPVRDPAGHALDHQVADLDAVVASVRGPVVAVGGISLGAHAAARWTATSAWRGGPVLACLPSWIGRGNRGVGAHAAVAAELRDRGVAAMLARLRTDAALPAWLRETLVTDYARHDPASLTAALTALDGGDAPSEEELAALATDLVVVAWSGDPAHPVEVAQRWCRAAPSARLATIAMTDLDADLAALGCAAFDVC